MDKNREECVKTNADKSYSLASYCLQMHQCMCLAATPSMAGEKKKDHSTQRMYWKTLEQWSDCDLQYANIVERFKRERNDQENPHKIHQHLLWRSTKQLSPSLCTWTRVPLYSTQHGPLRSRFSHQAGCGGRKYRQIKWNSEGVSVCL